MKQITLVYEGTAERTIKSRPSKQLWREKMRPPFLSLSFDTLPPNAAREKHFRPMSGEQCCQSANHRSPLIVTLCQWALKGAGTWLLILFVYYILIIGNYIRPFFESWDGIKKISFWKVIGKPWPKKAVNRIQGCKPSKWSAVYIQGVHKKMRFFSSKITATHPLHVWYQLIWSEIWVYTHSYWLAIFCTANTSPVLARESRGGKILKHNI